MTEPSEPEGTAAETPVGAETPADGSEDSDLEVIEGDDIVVSDDEDSTPRLEPIDHRQERTRGTLALLLVGVFGFTVIASFVVAFFASGDADWDRMRGILEVLLPAETALLGSALGFYFGTRANDGGSG